MAVLVSSLVLVAMSVVAALWQVRQGRALTRQRRESRGFGRVDGAAETAALIKVRSRRDFPRRRPLVRHGEKLAVGAESFGRRVRISPPWD